MRSGHKQNKNVISRLMDFQIVGAMCSSIQTIYIHYRCDGEGMDSLCYVKSFGMGDVVMYCFNYNAAIIVISLYIAFQKYVYIGREVIIN